MSSIIKSQRIRSEEIIDFSTIQLDIELDNNLLQDINEDSSLYDEVEKLQQYKEKEIKDVQKDIDFRLKEAQEQINSMYAESFIRSRNIEDEAAKLKKDILLEATIQKEKIIQDAKESASKIYQEALEEKNKLISETENEMVNTMMYLMRLIISDELTYDTRWLKMIIRKVLNKEEILGEVKIVISPDVYSKMSKNSLEDISLLHDELIVVQSDKLNKTECELVCNQGTIVYDVSKGMERIIRDVSLLLEVK